MLTPDQFQSWQEAVAYIVENLWSKHYSWLEVSEFGDWAIDFDVLRNEMSGAHELPRWLHGRHRCEPKISQSYAFDLEAARNSTGGPTALPATNLEDARAAGRRVMVSHAAALYFYKEDPFSEIEKALMPNRPTLMKPNEPAELSKSLAKFREEHGDSQTAFLMMKFGKTSGHRRIVEAIGSVLGDLGIKALRADEREYDSDLYGNIRTYLHACTFGIAIFERLEGDEFNPNVSLEVGYMLALGKQVCLLKDKTLKGLHADLVGKLYRDFDTQDPEGSIPERLRSWLRDWRTEIGIRHFPETKT